MSISVRIYNLRSHCFTNNIGSHSLITSYLLFALLTPYVVSVRVRATMLYHRELFELGERGQ